MSNFEIGEETEKTMSHYTQMDHAVFTYDSGTYVPKREGLTIAMFIFVSNTSL